VWKINTQPMKGRGHFAAFPEELIDVIVRASTAEGDLVLDPFCGSGTTGVVCRRLGRSFVGIDLQPQYLKLAESRIATGV
jgi:site-specific DNA-methyltransferase (cytosine-N4-specific)